MASFPVPGDLKSFLSVICRAFHVEEWFFALTSFARPSLPQSFHGPLRRLLAFGECQIELLLQIPYFCDLRRVLSNTTPTSVHHSEPPLFEFPESFSLVRLPVPTSNTLGNPSSQIFRSRASIFLYGCSFMRLAH